MYAVRESQSVITSVVAYPVRNDGVLLDPIRSGALTALRGNEVSMILEGELPLGHLSLLLGSAQADGAIGYWGAVVARDAKFGGSREVRAVHGGIAEEILGEAGRTPYLDSEQFRYRFQFSDEAYASWVEAGVLRPQVLDHVLVCPKCGAVPTFRFACRRCSSGRLQRELMVHHFACAHVGPVSQFRDEKSLRCPKCQTSHLIAGTDFEYAPGEHTCLDCGTKDREATQIGHCLSCDTRFPLHQAVEQELLGYDADQLDALALVPELA